MYMKLKRIINKWLFSLLLMMILVVAVYKIILPFVPFWVGLVIISTAVFLIVVAKILPNQDDDLDSKSDDTSRDQS